MPKKPTSATRATPATSDTARSLYAVAVITALIGVLVGTAATVAWVERTGARSSASQPAPQWVTPSEVRATTRDGTIVKARVALDAVNASNRSAVERRMQQVGLVLELSIGSHSRHELVAPDGISRLAADMLQRLNDYLVAQGADPLRSVAIQDLWYTTR
jgi:flagellar basal body-associated protein FliL